VIDWLLKLVHALHFRDFGFTACTDSRYDAVKSAVSSVVDDPSPLFVLVNLLDLGVELCASVEPIPLPQLSNLPEDLLAIWVAPFPLHRRMEPVHERVNLQAGRVVDFLQAMGQLVLVVILGTSA
jgi:hypothetical protein